MNLAVIESQKKSKNLAFLKYIPAYPLLLGLYPVLALMASNVSEIDLTKSTRSIWIAMGMVILVWLLFFLIFRSWHKAALGTSLTLLVFFAQAHVQPYYGVLVTLATGLLIWIFLLKPDRLVSLTPPLNFAGLILVIIPIFQLSVFEKAADEFAPASSKRPVNEDTALLNPSLMKPDVYLFILDTYPRADFLMEEFNFDNTPFTEELQSLSLYVAEGNPDEWWASADVWRGGARSPGAV